MFWFSRRKTNPLFMPSHGTGPGSSKNVFCSESNDRVAPPYPGLPLLNDKSAAPVVPAFPVFPLLLGLCFLNQGSDYEIVKNLQ